MVYYGNMKYEAFVQRARELPCFTASLLIDGGDSKRNAENQLVRWEKKGLVWRLKRGLYTLPDEQRARSLSLRWLANRLYSPSYVSLDTVLSFYELIPEAVTVVTSIAVAKTAAFNNRLGRFTYTCIKRDRFFGFEEVPDENGILVRIATPEKALLDRIYFDPSWRDESSYFEENLRLQNIALLRSTHLKQYARQFNSAKIDRAVYWLIKLRMSS